MKKALLLSTFFIITCFLTAQVFVPEIKDKNTIVKVSQSIQGVVDVIYNAKPHGGYKDHYSHLRLNIKDKSYEIFPVVNDDFFKENKLSGSDCDFSIDGFVIINAYDITINKMESKVFIYDIANKELVGYVIPHIYEKSNLLKIKTIYDKKQQQIIFFEKRTKYDAMGENGINTYEMYTISLDDHTLTPEEFSFENKGLSISEIYSSGNPSAMIVSYNFKGKGYAILDLTTKELKTIPVNTKYDEIFSSQYYELNENEGVLRIILGTGGSAQVYKYIYINTKEELITDLGDISMKKHTFPAYMDFVTVFYDQKIVQTGKESMVIIENGKLDFREGINIPVFSGGYLAKGFKYIQDGKLIFYSDMGDGVKIKGSLDLITTEYTETKLDKKYQSEIISKPYILNGNSHYLLYLNAKDGTTFYEEVDF